MNSRSMISVYILCCFVVFYATNTEGKRIRTPCATSSLFRCDSGDCIHKHKWCNGGRDCGDNSDEKYCRPRTNSCDADIHFQCDSGMCIPVQGYCDGYSSCPDKSDERNCPCEELHESEGNVQLEAFIDQYRTQQRCWKISVNDDQYVDLEISGIFYNRLCTAGNITLNTGFNSTDFGGNTRDESLRVLCPLDFKNSSYKRSLMFQEDVLIRYRSNYYVPGGNSNKDFFNMTFQKVDLKCKDPHSFKCTNVSCISPEKQCDGVRDCTNGQDEENCDYGALSAEYLNVCKAKSIQWMRSQRNADWGWKGNTHRAVLALFLAGDANFNGSKQEDELIAKQLELEVFTYLLRQKFGKVSSSELALYINALLVVCHDPRNFYGYDLIETLKEDLKKDSSFAPPFPYLTLCNAKEPASEDAVERLLQTLEINSPNFGFVLELQALATMALSCIIHNGKVSQEIQQNVTLALSDLKKHQMEDGSFGNEYTTALMLQTLIANGEENSEDWNIKSSLQFLARKQGVSGSFGDFLTTYFTMPILNAKSLVDVGKVHCSDGMKRPRDGSTASDISSRLGKKMFVKYSLFVGDDKDQIHPLLLRTPENITVLELMTLAADIDPKYEFKTHAIKTRKYIYEISNIVNDPENNKFWFIYEGSDNGTLPFTEQSPDKIKVHEKDHIIMWYKTLNSF